MGNVLVCFPPPLHCGADDGRQERALVRIINASVQYGVGFVVHCPHDSPWRRRRRVQRGLRTVRVASGGLNLGAFCRSYQGVRNATGTLPKLLLLERRCSCNGEHESLRLLSQ